MTGRDLGSNDVSITTISGGGGGGSRSSSITVVDVPVTMTLPPAYDSLLPLYDDKDLPNYNDVVGTVSPEQPPTYDNHDPPPLDSQPTTTPASCAT